MISVAMAGLTFLADSSARSIALYVDLPFRRLPTIPMILTDPAAAPDAKLGREATEAAAAPRNRRRFMLLIKNVCVCAGSMSDEKVRFNAKGVPYCHRNTRRATT